MPHARCRKPGGGKGRGQGEADKIKKMTHSFTDPKTPYTTGVHGINAVGDRVGAQTRQTRSVRVAHPQ